jgi:hypothetical protein
VLARLARWSYLAFEIKKRFLSRASERGALHPWESEPDFGPAWKAETWPAAEEEFAAIQRIARGVGAKLLVVAVPYEPQLDVGLLDRERGVALEPQARLRGICERLGIPFLDLEPAFEARLRAPEAPKLYEDKVHLSPEGHVLAERVLRERLVAEDWLPSEALR